MCACVRVCVYYERKKWHWNVSKNIFYVHTHTHTRTYNILIIFVYNYVTIALKITTHHSHICMRAIRLKCFEFENKSNYSLLLLNVNFAEFSSRWNSFFNHPNPRYKYDILIRLLHNSLSRYRLLLQRKSISFPDRLLYKQYWQ